MWGDRLELFGTETVTHDSNVFRISRDRNSLTFLGSPDRADTYRTTSIGFNLDVPVSLQRFRGGVTLTDTRYDRFTDLDFNGRSGQASWLWQVDHKLSGQLSYSASRALASFLNFQSRIPDPLDTRQWSGSAAYLLTPRWQAQLELSELEQRNGTAIRQDNDVNVKDADFTFSHILPSGNQIGISLKTETGSYPHRQFVAGSVLDNAYTQHSAGVVADWTLDGKSHLNARADEVRRNFRQLSARDFSGTTYRVAYDWKPTGKLTLTGVLQRDISVVEDIRTSFVLIKGISLRPSYEFSSKITISGTLDYSIRDYLGDPGFVLGAVPSPSDRLRVAGINIAYRPRRPLSIALSLQRESRSSNIPFNDYLANVVGLTARLTY